MAIVVRETSLCIRLRAYTLVAVAISEIHIIGCSITATNVTALIDVNGQLIDVSPEVLDIDVDAPANWTLQGAVPGYLAPVRLLYLPRVDNVGYTDVVIVECRVRLENWPYSRH